MMRREAAEQSIRVRSKIESSKVDDALHRYAAIERKVDEIEAYADTISTESGKTLEAQFAELETSESVEKELEALKARKTSKGNEA